MRISFTSQQLRIREDNFVSTTPTDNLDAVRALIDERLADLAVLSDSQREEVQKLTTNVVLSQSTLTSGQKWDVTSIIAKMASGALAIFAVAGYFTVKNAAQVTASSVSTTQVAEKLKLDPKFVASVAGSQGFVPNGAIMAFDSVQGCPSGWTNYSVAAGRVIIGAGQGPGLASRSPQEQGGAETHILRMAELPAAPVTVSLIYSRVNIENGGYPIVRGTGPAGGDYVSPASTNNMGSGSPIDIMPPYLALLTCKKI